MRQHHGSDDELIGAHLRNLIKFAMRSCPAIANPLWSLAYPYVIRRDGTYFGSEYTDRDSAFQQIYDENRWLSCESRSGRGSTLAYTKPLRRSLAKSLRRLNATVFLDAPCGDFNWMRHVELPDGTSYIGGDIVAQAQRGRETRWLSLHQPATAALSLATSPVAHRRFRGSGATPLPRALVTRPSEIGSG